MARDMWTMINRELAKIQRAKGGVSDTPFFDELSEITRYAERDRERQRIRKEERSEDAMKIMDLHAGKYTKNYDNDSLNVNIKRLESYMYKNKGRLDETAMDFYDVTLNGLRDQKALNVDFKQYQDRLPGEVTKMGEYLKTVDKDKVWTAENINELKKMQAPLVNFTGGFRAKHGDRLASAAYQDYNLELSNIGEMNSFLVQSALDDGHLREDEAQVFLIDMQNGNTKASDRLNKLENVKLDSQIKTLTAKMSQEYQEIDLLKKFTSGEGSLPTNSEGEYDPEGDYSQTWKEYVAANKETSEEQLKGDYYKKISSRIDAAVSTDKQYQGITTSGSYFDTIDPDILVKPKITMKKPKKTLVPKQYEEKVQKANIAQEIKAIEDKDITPSKIEAIEQKHGISLAKGTVDQLTIKGLKGRRTDAWNRLTQHSASLDPTGFQQARYYGTRSIDEIGIIVSRRVNNYVNKGEPENAEDLIAAFEDYKNSQSALKEYYKNKKK